jgi:ABC-2 type transport system permease protein
MGIAANAASFLVLRFFIDGGHILQPLLLATLPGMAAAAAASIASLAASGGVAEEINAGTLEQTHLSPVPAWALAAGRLGALTLEALLVAAILGIGWATYQVSIRRALREGRLGP